jgi:hypothetical protein
VDGIPQAPEIPVEKVKCQCNVNGCISSYNTRCVETYKICGYYTLANTLYYATLHCNRLNSIPPSHRTSTL